VNHEQMAAWLTLEGWEYRPRNLEWFDSLFRGTDRWVLSPSNGRVGRDRVDPSVQTGKPFSAPAPLYTAPAELIERVYELLTGATK
jgi:hypothetical protein